MKMQGQKEKCKEDMKSYSLDRFEQVNSSDQKRFEIKPPLPVKVSIKLFFINFFFLQSR